MRSGTAQHPPGEIFRPRYLPAGIWLQLDGFFGGVVYEDLENFAREPRADGDQELSDGFIGLRRDDNWWEERVSKRARGLFQLPVMSDRFTWRSGGTHPVKRDGFPLTHANFLTSTSCQGHTIRTCAYPLSGHRFVIEGP